VDLVKAQFEVASGLPLPWKQEDLHPRGWAFECRITCEDPYRNFLPCPGQVKQLRLPQGAGVRLDTHLYAGYEVPQAFDSMVAKLITYGEDREQARQRMLAALGEFQITGIPTSIPFHRQILEHPQFVAGNLSTHFITDHLGQLTRCKDGEVQELAALAAALESLFSTTAAPTGPTRGEAQVWKEAGRVLR
jgi:acetyl/propionyl-CoA carboxylase alpha subunit